MKPQLILLLPAFLWACGSGADKISASHSDTAICSTGSYAAAVTPGPMPALPACYQYTTSKDTMMLRLRSYNPDGEITGDLDYRKGEKESSSGSFFGKMTGDTLLANYSYLQKGKRKVKEVAFVRRGQNWVEGSGPSAERGGIRRFTDPAAITFEQAVYQQVPCQ